MQMTFNAILPYRSVLPIQKHLRETVKEKEETTRPRTSQELQQKRPFQWSNGNNCIMAEMEVIWEARFRR